MSFEIKAKNIVQFLSALVLVLVVVFLPQIIIKMKSDTSGILGNSDIPQALIGAKLNEENIKYRLIDTRNKRQRNSDDD